MCEEPKSNNAEERRLLKEIADLKQQLKEKDNEIAELQAKLKESVKREDILNQVWRGNVQEIDEHWLEYSEQRFNQGINTGIQKERERRNAGRKKNPFLEEEYLATAEEIQKLLDMGHTMKEIIENGMITKVNPKTKQIEPVSKSTIYRCLRTYRSAKK